MLKELIAIGMATTLMTAPPQNTNDGTYYQDVNITETYEYETNEVNNANDLIVGNIYKLEFTNDTTQSWWQIGLFDGFKLNTGLTCLDGITRRLVIYNHDAITEIQFRYDGDDYYVYHKSPQLETISCYVVFNLIYSNTGITYQNFSASDYLGEKTTTIEPMETEGLYNLAYHFLYSRIYTNTELQGMETTLFGTTINMNMWLSHTTAIIIICLLLVVLIKFVIWLFKIVSGGMLWK